MTQRIAILTQNQTNPLSAKTAVSLLRYRGDDVAALIDTETAGKTAQSLLGCGGDTPIVAGLDEALAVDPGVNTLAIGVAPPGGQLPEAMRAVVIAAAERGMTVLSGLHQFLTEDPEIAGLAKAHGATLLDIRKNSERTVADRKDIRPGCLRLHTVGQDCSCGKMVASVELARGLQHRGKDAKFVATGQTGILVAPGINAGLTMTDEERADLTAGGAPIDCVVADFINGASERLVKRNQHHDIIVIEGQATLVHPSYSSVTYGLLHGTLPHGLILCYEAQRPHMHGRPHIPLTPLKQIVKLYDTVSNLEQPCRFIGVAMNSRLLESDAAVEEERRRVSNELDLPVCDVYREGPKRLVDAALELQYELAM